MTDNEFIMEIAKNQSIDIDVARFFAKKTASRFGQFNYYHEDVAKFLGHDRADIGNGTNARCLVELVKRNLDRETHYIIDDGTPAVDRRGPFSSQPIKKGVKLNYWLTRSVSMRCVWRQENQRQLSIDTSLEKSTCLLYCGARRIRITCWDNSPIQKHRWESQHIEQM